VSGNLIPDSVLKAAKQLALFRFNEPTMSGIKFEERLDGVCEVFCVDEPKLVRELAEWLAEILQERENNLRAGIAGRAIFGGGQ
jgi:hypothetical protein